MGLPQKGSKDAKDSVRSGQNCCCDIGKPTVVVTVNFLRFLCVLSAVTSERIEKAAALRDRATACFWSDLSAEFD
jgi:hypothetical protein